jgi:hypothetical protein
VEKALFAYIYVLSEIGVKPRPPTSVRGYKSRKIVAQRNPESCNLTPKVLAQCHDST